MLKGVQAVILATAPSDRSGIKHVQLTDRIVGQELILSLPATLNALSLPTTIIMSAPNHAIDTIITQHYPDMRIVQSASGTIPSDVIMDHAPDILIMEANHPLVSKKTIIELYTKHKETNATISFLAAHHGEPSDNGYNWVIKKNNRIQICSNHELSAQEQSDHCCVNGGVYFMSRPFFDTYFNHIGSDKNNEYLHTLVNKASQLDKKVSMVLVPFDQIRRVSTYQELWAAEHIKRSEYIRHWMDQGVRFSAPQTVHIEANVSIGAGTHIGCSVHLLSGTRIGVQSTIDSFSIIQNSHIGDNVTIHSHSIVRDTIVNNHAIIGPFAHLQEKTKIGVHSTIGNFVETKRTSIGTHTKAKHLSYLGDASIGSEVTIGAGTIICNYDGNQKQHTTIENKSFIGSNTTLIAPIIIQTEAFIAAGSVITKKVPPQSLAIARTHQINKEGYANRLKKKHTKTIKESDNHQMPQ